MPARRSSRARLHARLGHARQRLRREVQARRRADVQAIPARVTSFDTYNREVRQLRLHLRARIKLRPDQPVHGQEARAGRTKRLAPSSSTSLWRRPTTPSAATYDSAYASSAYGGIPTEQVSPISVVVRASADPGSKTRLSTTTRRGISNLSASGVVGRYGVQVTGALSTRRLSVETGEKVHLRER